VDSGELSRCDLDDRLDSDVVDELFDRDECRESEVLVEFIVSLRLRSRLVGVWERFLFSFSSLTSVFSDVGVRCSTVLRVRRGGVCGVCTGSFRAGKASNSFFSSSTDSLRLSSCFFSVSRPRVYASNRRSASLLFASVQTNLTISRTRKNVAT
jgi:hypothetical protein